MLSASAMRSSRRPGGSRTASPSAGTGTPGFPSRSGGGDRASRWCQPPSFVTCDVLSSAGIIPGASCGRQPLVDPPSRVGQNPAPPLRSALDPEAQAAAGHLRRGAGHLRRHRGVRSAASARRPRRRRAHPRGEDRAGEAGPRRQGEHGLRAHRRALPGGRGRALPRAAWRAARGDPRPRGRDAARAPRAGAPARCRSRAQADALATLREMRFDGGKDTSGSTPSAGPTRRC